VSIDTSPKSMILAATNSGKQVLRGMNKLIHSSAWNRHSRKFISKILHKAAPLLPKAPTLDAPHSPAPVPLVTQMDRYAR
jgi:hypothetical protein